MSPRVAESSEISAAQTIFQTARNFGLRRVCLSIGSIIIGCVAALTFSVALMPPAAAHMGYHEEIDSITSRIQSNPDSAELYIRRCNLYREHQEWSLAGADLDQARRIDPELPTIDLYRGKLLLDLGDFVKARQTLNAFLKKEPHNIKGLVTRARIWEPLGRNLRAAARHRVPVLPEGAPSETERGRKTA